MKRRRLGLWIGIAAAVLVSAGGFGGLLWYLFADRGYTTHGVSFREAGWDVESLTPAQAKASNSDWAIELVTYQGDEGVIRLYGTRMANRQSATNEVGAYAAEMADMAQGTDIDGPRRVQLPADGTALITSWQSGHGGGLAYAVAVGDQVVLITCLGRPGHSNNDINSTCRRIAKTIKPA